MGHVRRRNGRSGWYGNYAEANGRRREVLLRGCRTKAQARSTLRRLESQAWERAEGLAPVRRADCEVTTLRAAWQADIMIRCRPRTVETYEADLEQVLDWLRRDALARGQAPPTMASEIGLEAVRRYAAARMAGPDGVSARTVQKAVGALRQMLEWATRQLPPLLATNPLAGWRRLKGPPRRRRRALTELEIAKLLHHSPSPFREIWAFALGTGLRAGELGALEWDDVAWERGEVAVRAETSKSGRGRTLPLRDDLLAMLRRLRAGCPGGQRLIFVNSHGTSWRDNLSRRLKPCLRAAGLDETIDVHCLRHTFGSHLIRAGVNPKTVQMLLGHSSLQVTLDCYTHEVEYEDRRAAVEALRLPIAPGLPAHRRPRLAAGGTA